MADRQSAAPVTEITQQAGAWQKPARDVNEFRQRLEASTGWAPTATAALQTKHSNTVQYDVTMSTPTREELDAKLEAIEARMDGRVASIEGKIEAFLARMEEREKTDQARAETSIQRMAHVESSISSIESSSSNLKYWLMGTGIAIVLGVAAFNGTLLSNMVASFESGKNTTAAQAQVSQQLRDTQALLEEVKKSVVVKETTKN